MKNFSLFSLSLPPFSLFLFLSLSLSFFCVCMCVGVHMHAHMQGCGCVYVCACLCVCLCISVPMCVTGDRTHSPMNEAHLSLSYLYNSQAFLLLLLCLGVSKAFRVSLNFQVSNSVCPALSVSPLSVLCSWGNRSVPAGQVIEIKKTWILLLGWLKSAKTKIIFILLRY